MGTNVPRSRSSRPDGSPTDRVTRVSTDRWTAVPDVLLGVLTPREHQLLHALLSYRWTADATIRPFVKTLARQMGDCHPRTVQRAAARLQARGLIEIVPRFRVDEGQSANEYRPTAALLALLPRDTDDDAADVGPRSHTPTTTAAYRRRETNQRNRTTRNGTANGRPKNLLETRSKCPVCPEFHVPYSCRR